MALDGGDPRLNVDQKDFAGPQGIVNTTRPQMRKLHDLSITFEEYHYYALETRKEQEEAHARGTGPKTSGILSTIIPSKSGKGNTSPPVSDGDEKGFVPNVNLSDPSRRASVTDQEWINASRAIRTATAASVFYLITTDILGPFGLPYAFATTGYGCVYTPTSVHL